MFSPSKVFFGSTTVTVGTVLVVATNSMNAALPVTGIFVAGEIITLILTIGVALNYRTREGEVRGRARIGSPARRLGPRRYTVRR